MREHEAKKIRKREMIELQRAIGMSKDQLEKEKKEKRKKLDNLLKEKKKLENSLDKTKQEIEEIRRWLEKENSKEVKSQLGETEKPRKSDAQPEKPGDAGACAKENQQEVKQVEAKILSELIKSREEELECPVCTEVASPPLFCCEDQHLICSQCRPKVNSQNIFCKCSHNHEWRICVRFPPVLSVEDPTLPNHRGIALLSELSRNFGG